MRRSADLGRPAGVGSADSGFEASATNVNYTSNRCFPSHISISGFDQARERSYVVHAHATDADPEYDEYVFGESQVHFTINVCEYTQSEVARYSVTVDGKEVTSFTVAHPAIAVRTIHRHSPRATVQARLTLRGIPLGPRRVLVERYQCGSWGQGFATTTSRAGYAFASCTHRAPLRGCQGIFRFNYNDVAYSKTFHLPVRTR